ncbi:MAG: hypothetical protein H0X33_00405 [Taibaiella sp.]|nr:hypothetical protein [Taibaiella sp.]
MENKSNNAPDKKNGEALPGYPHYPASEDITRADNNNGEVDLNEEQISLPDVSDITGQEHITPASLGSVANTTPSSANEEDIVHATSLDDTEDDTKIVMGTDADVTAEDLRMLETADQNMDTQDDRNLFDAGLDDTDNEGDPLSEKSLRDDVSGKDLDVPGSEDDDSDELIGEEDEENNYYSLGGDNHEAQEEDNFNS